MSNTSLHNDARLGKMSRRYIMHAACSVASKPREGRSIADWQLSLLTDAAAVSGVLGQTFQVSCMHPSMSHSDSVGQRTTMISTPFLEAVTNIPDLGS